jgi:hypothetical protein
LNYRTGNYLDKKQVNKLATLLGRPQDLPEYRRIPLGRDPDNRAYEWIYKNREIIWPKEPPKKRTIKPTEAVKEVTKETPKPQIKKKRRGACIEL